MKCKDIVYTLCVLAQAAIVSTQSIDCLRYAGKSVRLPFTEDKTHDPSIRATIKSSRGNKEISIPEDTKDGKSLGVDSGSTILALRSYFIPDFPSDPSGLTEGYVTYTSGRFYSGYWFPVEIFFPGEDGHNLTARVQALAVTVACKCPWYTESMGARCKDNPDTGEKCVDNPREEFHYLGITFGYGAKTGPYTPDKNALIHITHYDGVPIDSSWRQGYVLHERSIEVGLSAENTRNFKCLKLEKPDGSTIPDDWERPNFQLRFDNNGWQQGRKALVDSGVDSVEFWSAECENRRGEDSALNPGTRVSVQIPDANSPIASWEYTWRGNNHGDDCGMPLKAFCRMPSRPYAGVNTGKHLLENYDVLFDAGNGVWGARRVYPTCRSQSGLWEQEL